jgi:hypothetical protein
MAARSPEAKERKRQRRAARDKGRPGKTRRFAMYLRDDMRCVYCQQTVTPGTATTDPTAATLDHIIEFTDGGTWDASNVVTCCTRCNSIKGARGVEFLSIKSGIPAKTLKRRQRASSRKPLAPYKEARAYWKAL